MADDAARRHWHGNSGDRHEHLNVWTQGGAKGPTPRAPWALTPEMIAYDTARRASAASNSSVKSDGAADSPTTPSVSERRRSSVSGGSALFTNLHTQKRESTDPEFSVRRASWNEQRGQSDSFLGKLWDNYTRGSPRN
ncbi:hypothetical protein N7495_006937 [Penicillium taxi]|uniref:uncharacterized protein n=1 Tax=Penicillium taxi TaxID=168475 RepID=UPI002545257F|nr:uncharacterized protein N7495_006937 [Penicillium taxi]KAJ5895246.1 hypothetical protein N7495_006937 [Penicillium taxi]